MNTREYFENLNMSHESQSIYKLSESYRENLTKELKKVLHTLNIESMLVIGAGNLSDINYSEVLDSPIRITLTDIDMRAMRQGIQWQGLENSHGQLDKITTKQMNYLGDNSDDMIQEFLANLNKDNKSEEKNIVKAVDEFFQKLINEMSLSPLVNGDNVDLIMVLPIYTQLLFNTLSKSVKRVASVNLDNYLLQNMVLVLDRFNNELLNLTKQDGYIFVLSDIIEQSNIEELSYYTSDSLKKQVEQYESDYGMGLGSYGIYNIKEKTKIIKEYYLLWPFDLKKQFILKGYLLQK